MNIGNRMIAGTLAGVMALGVILTPAAALAQQSKAAKNEKNHRIAASALGAAGLYLLGRRNTTLGAVAIAGSAYEAKRMQDSVNERHRRARAAAYRRGYRNGEVYAMNHSRTRTGSSHYVWVRARTERCTRSCSRKDLGSHSGKKVGWSKNGKR